MSDTTLPAGGQPTNPGGDGEGPFLPGARVGGRYTIEERIGLGGMGVVYRARQDLTHKLVALKVIRSTMSRGPMLERFLDEIRLLGRLDHHGLVSIHDADLHHLDQGGDALFFTMDLIEGAPITSWAHERNLDWCARLSLMARVCEAMQYAHDHGVIHCDLKPGNLLVRRSGDPVVIDFGLAYLRADAAAAATGPARESADATDGLGRGLAGTPSYMSPEQFQGGVQELRAGQSVDVYALGVVTFELLTGRLPYDLPEAPTLHDIRHAVLFTPARKLSEFLPHVDRELERVVAKSLRKDPADRYFSVAQLLRALTRFLPSATPTPEPEWRPAAGLMIPSTNWILDERLGEGGVGEVWTCHHRTLKHKRIVKFCADEEKASFLRRELTLYRLLKEKVGQNPHFARLEEVALEEPPRYLMSEYIEARDLPKWHAAEAAEASIPQEVVLEIVAQAADALQAAHDAGVLHRDVKPSNILVRGRAGDISSLHVWVGDFGIGQVISEEVLGDTTRSGFTRTLLGQAHSSYSGTHFYMAPELLAGGPASVRSDLYALGVVLYQSLTGDFQRVVTIDWAADIPDPLLRADLERCFARNPASRFPSAAELSDRLRRLPERREQSARAASEAALRERRAYRRGLARAGILAGAIIAGVSTLAVYAFQQSLLARTQSALAEKQKEIAQSQTRAAQHAQAQTLLGEIKALRSSTEPGKQTTAWASVTQLAAICPPSLRGALREEAAAVQALPAIALSPVPSLQVDGRLWVSADLLSAVSLDTHGGLSRLRRSDQAWQPVGALPPAPAAIATVLVSDSGQTVVAKLEGGKGVVWCIGGSWRPLGGPDVTALAVADADTGVAAVGRPDGSIEIYRADQPEGPARVLGADRAAVASISTPRSVQRPLPSVRPAHALAFDGDGKRLASASRDSLHAMVWDVDGGSLEAVATSLHPITAVAWNEEWAPTDADLRWPDAHRLLATGAEDGTVVLWDLAARQGPAGTEHHVHLMPQPGMARPDPRRRQVIHASFATAGRHLLALYDDHSLGLFDNQTHTFIESFTDLPPSTGVLAARDQLLALQSEAGRPIFWASRSGQVFEEARLFFAAVSELDSNSDGRLIVARSPEGTVMVGTHGLRPLHRLPQAFGHSARFIPDKDALITLAGSTIQLWTSEQPPPNPRVIEFLPTAARDPGDWIDMDVISLPGDTRLAAYAKSARDESSVVVVQRSREGEGKEWPAPAVGSLWRVRLHPSGEWLVALAAGIAPAWIVNVSDGSFVPLPGPATRFLDAAFSPDGRFLALRDASGVLVFSAPSWSPLFSLDLRSRLADAAPIAFSHDSSLFVAAGLDSLPVVYRVADHGPHPWQAATSLISPRPRDAVAFRFGGPGRACLLCGTSDGYLQVWNIALLRTALGTLNLDWEWPEWHWPESLEPLDRVQFKAPQ